eukprot:4237850-Pyramimonas_sp.AAC.1
MGRVSGWALRSTLPMSQRASLGASHVSTPRSETHFVAAREQRQPRGSIPRRGGRRMQLRHETQASMASAADRSAPLSPLCPR